MKLTEERHMRGMSCLVRRDCVPHCKNVSSRRSREIRGSLHLKRQMWSFFVKLLGANRVLTDPENLKKYNRDWLGIHEGKSQLALFPNNNSEVSSILQHCHGRRLGVVPQGGNTGLVQGSMPVHDEVILSTEKMNQIMHFDELSGVMTCQAGCVLEALDNYVEERGFVIPLDLAARGSCQIGGNVATNAGGTRLLRYGSLHGSVLGLDVVLPDGQILEMLTSLRKDNTGYDLKQLFIGSEGTLGVITSVAIQCQPLGMAQNTCLLALKDFEAALAVVQKARWKLGEILSALEFMDSAAYHLPFDYFPDLQNPLPDHFSKIYLLMETNGSNDDHDKEKLSAFLQTVLSDGDVIDGVVAQDGAQVQNMWKIRECITQSLTLRGPVHKYDLSLPLRSMHRLIEDLRQRLKHLDCLVVGFGHLGDGNIHLNVSCTDPLSSQAVLDNMEPYVYEWTAAQKGSISAEHGLGTMKAHHIHYSKNDRVIAWMKRLKSLFDPHGILNPYKVLPPDQN